MVKKIIVKKIMSDKEIASREGDYFNEDHYNIILNKNADVYTDDGKLLIKFRKNVLDKELGRETAALLRKAARKKHENRGASAGPLDRNKLSNYIGEFVNKGKFRTKFKSSKTGVLSKQATSNLSPSNIIGFFDKPDRNLKGKGAPCRLTAFNRDNPEIWKKVEPFLQLCDKQFSILTPYRHQKQLKQAQSVPEFAIDGTSFSTITINYSWRTALHRDAGDLVEGFGNLIVLKDPTNENDYTGCCTGFPQYGVAVDVKHGDFLAMNVHEWHCNTEFKPVSSEIKGKWNKRETVNGWYFNRLSMVCYLREKMIRCKDMKTNKIQLLNSKGVTNFIYRRIQKYVRPNTYNEYSNNLKRLHILVVEAIQKTEKPNLINTRISDYYSYLLYYYTEFSSYFTVGEMKEMKKELNILINTLKTLLNAESRYILEKGSKIFTK